MSDPKPNDTSADNAEGQEDEGIVETLSGDHPAIDEATVAMTDSPDLESQLATEQDRVLRLQAELQNVLSRKSRELADEKRYASLKLMRDMLPVLDNIDRAIESAENASEADDQSSLLQGVRLVRQQMMTVFTQHACEQIPAEGEVFDPEVHEAILQQPSADFEAGAVTMVTQQGYKLHDRVIRPAQVIVSAGPPQE